MRIRCEIFLPLSLFVHRSKQLDIHDDVEECVDYCLEIEKVCITAESVDPSDPHKEGILH